MAALSAGAILLAPAASWAALPDMAEFNIGTGSKIKPGVQEMQDMSAAKAKAWNIAVTASLPDAAQQALAALDGVDELMQVLDFEGARTILASPTISILGVRRLPSRAKVGFRGAWAEECPKRKSCTSSLEEAQGNLQQLEEWCFSHVTPIFNAQDKEQVMSRSGLNALNEKNRAELEEPLEYLENSRSALREVLKNARVA